MKIPLRNFSSEELAKLAASSGENPYRGRQLARGLYKRGISAFSEFTDLPKPFLEKLSRDYAANSLELVVKQESKLDGSRKYLFKTQDGHFVETVLIFQGSRRTVCLSAQIGCKMGCRFCASGKEGFVRHLECGEILDQIAWVRKDYGKWPTNLVYMGMGEPLDNFDSVVRSIRIANAPQGYGIGQRRITVSTVGVVPGIKKLGEENLGQIKLSFSLHSPDPAVRSKLIPVNRKYPLASIVEALKNVQQSFKRKMTMEYILIEGLTDREKDARELTRISVSLNAKVNLIPYNPIVGEPYARPSPAGIRAFQQRLEKKGVRTTVRYSAGQDIDAACGQLRLREKRRSRVI
jgi:23S rRNA (adenine2503-C2)-methyltransferase